MHLHAICEDNEYLKRFHNTLLEGKTCLRKTAVKFHTHASSIYIWNQRIFSKNYHFYSWNTIVGGSVFLFNKVFLKINCNYFCSGIIIIESIFILSCSCKYRYRIQFIYFLWTCILGSISKKRS